MVLWLIYCSQHSWVSTSVAKFCKIIIYNTGQQGVFLPASHALCTRPAGPKIREVVTPICAIWRAKTGLGILTPYTREGVELLRFLPYIVGSKDKMCVWSIVISWFPVWSNSQEPFCSAIKRSSSKSDSQNFLTPFNTVRMGVTTPWDWLTFSTFVVCGFVCPHLSRVQWICNIHCCHVTWVWSTWWLLWVLV